MNERRSLSPAYLVIGVFVAAVMTPTDLNPGSTDSEELTETGEEQTGSDQQNKGQSDLRHDTASPTGPGAAAAGSGTPFLAEHGVQIHMEQLPQRHEANQYAHNERNRQRENNDGEIRRWISAARGI